MALIDLDGFKPVNDQFGHSVGDQLLIEVAQRLQHACGENGIVARIGGDEFAILLSPESTISSSACADHMLSALVPACTVDGHVIRVRASIGIATWPIDGETAETLFEAADRQLYAVKNYAAKVQRPDPAQQKNRHSKSG